MVVERRAVGEKFLGVGGFGVGDLDEDATGGEGVAVEAEGGEFVGDDGVEFGGFEPGADELGVGGIKGAMDGDHREPSFFF